ncbi:MAG: hypothetical protein KDD62_07080, partial [Bdellovibrionales bacterium]|nr:hypothetical protein [Bdellovibrionales bacterium]
SFHITDSGMSEYHKLQREIKAINSERADVSRERSKLALALEDPVWNVVEAYTDIVDLFKIGHSRWHKGYTLNTLPDSATPEAGKAEESPQLEFAEGDDLYRNDASLRMLHMAYRWHAARLEGKDDKNQFPILSVSNALHYGSEPFRSPYLDTFDMTVVIGDRRIPLSAQQAEADFDDVQFWLNTFMPLTEDKAGVIKDLRFYPRQSLDL